jgi:hypothetical protein
LPHPVLDKLLHECISSCVNKYVFTFN